VVKIFSRNYKKTHKNITIENPRGSRPTLPPADDDHGPQPTV